MKLPVFPLVTKFKSHHSRFMFMRWLWRNDIEKGNLTVVENVQAFLDKTVKEHPHFIYHADPTVNTAIKQAVTAERERILHQVNVAFTDAISDSENYW